jgi:hypothetical protein
VSQDGTHAPYPDEECSSQNAKKIARLNNRLRSSDHQSDMDEVETARNGKNTRDNKQKPNNDKQNPQPKCDTDQQSENRQSLLLQGPFEVLIPDLSL